MTQNVSRALIERVAQAHANTITNNVQLRTVPLRMTEPQAAVWFASGYAELVFQGGVGSGKTKHGARWMVRRMLEAPAGSEGMAVAPTYPLLSTFTVAALESACREAGIWWVHRKQEKLFLVGPNRNKIWLRSCEDPDKQLSGANLDSVWFDEAALTVRTAYERLSQRLRSNVDESRARCMLITTTPEGSDTWVEKDLVEVAEDWDNTEAGKAGKKCPILLVIAPTDTNPFLPEEFFERMRRVYRNSPEKLKNYMGGRAADATGSVYDAMTSENVQPISLEQISRGQLFVGWDFNNRPMVTVIGCWFERDKILHICGEVVSGLEGPTAKTRDHAKDVIRALRSLMHINYIGGRLYDDYQRAIHAFIDASGQGEHTNADYTDQVLVQNAGFLPRHDGANPRVRERVAAMNLSLSDSTLLIDATRAPMTHRAMRNHKYIKGVPQKKYKPGDFQCDHFTECVGYMNWGFNPIHLEGGQPSQRDWAR